MWETVKRRAHWLPGPINNDHLQTVTYTCALQRQYRHNLYNRASTPMQTFHPALFSLRNVRNPSLPIWLYKEGGLSFLKKQRGILGVGSDGQDAFPLMLFFLPSVFSHERRHRTTLGAAPMAPLMWDSLYTADHKTSFFFFLYSQDKKEDRINWLIASKEKGESVE